MCGCFGERRGIAARQRFAERRQHRRIIGDDPWSHQSVVELIIGVVPLAFALIYPLRRSGICEVTANRCAAMKSIVEASRGSEERTVMHGLSCAVSRRSRHDDSRTAMPTTLERCRQGRRVQSAESFDNELIRWRASRHTVEDAAVGVSSVGLRIMSSPHFRNSTANFSVRFSDQPPRKTLNSRKSRAGSGVPSCQMIFIGLAPENSSKSTGPHATNAESRLLRTNNWNFHPLPGLARYCLPIGVAGLALFCDCQ